MKKVFFSKAAAKALSKMPANTARRIRRKIDAYAEDPASQAANLRALTGYDEIRLRVGDWRVIMNDRGEVIQIIKIAPRGQAYKGA
ncbi:MAG: type II toxin-antitoxin system RelE/ParE family toxin [Pseudomonadota bacterium]